MMNFLHTRATLAAVGALLSLFCACLPLNDLNKAAGGRTGISGDVGGGSVAIDAGGGSVAIDAGASTATGGAGGLPASSTANGGTTVDAAEPADVSTSPGGNTAMPSAGTAAGGTGGTEGGTVATGIGGTGGQASATGLGGDTAGRPASGGTGGITAVGGTGGTTGSGGSTVPFAPELPDIVNSPVQGQITYSAGASWDIEGKQVPAFEIHTPTANYWLVKSAAAIVSITDTSGVQWINFSSGFRPNRGVPNLGGCCQPGDPEKLGLPVMTTDIDPSFTVTSTHLRLISTSDTVSYRIVWDFFLTHFTMTVDRAEKPFGFTYRGVPAGAIDAADQLVLSSGETLSPSSPYSGALSGSEPWVAYKHPLSKHALFLIQHTGDAIADTYQIADGDTATWTFGGDLSKKYITQTPVRFSLGLMNSIDDAVVTERIRFVVSAIE